MSDLTGQTLGKYQLIERLGRGGMADVYKGYQPGLDRYIAVKVMHPHLSEDPNFITRFRREARSVAELRHPNIVQVFDFDTQGENHYMVMEYIEGGRTLKQVLLNLSERGERLSIEQTLDIVIKLADALAYAHNLGMIHRDIKPANVLLASLDRPVLSDFGIARLINESGLTASGMLIGTPAYMSPEQGRGEHIDARSDIYSLGIVLYEMLTGRPPYDADTPYAIILKHINDPLTPPHVLTSPMPEAVERIVFKCLAKDATDRFAGMAELRDALRAAQSAIGLQKTTSTIASAAPTLRPIEPPSPAVRSPEPIVPAAAPPARSGDIKPVYIIGGVVGALVLIVVAIALITAPRPAAQTPASTSAPRTMLANTPEPGVTRPASSSASELIDAGYAQLLQSDTAAARDLFQQALDAEPDNAHALVGRATAELSDWGDMDAAAADLERAAQTIPEDPRLHFALGMLKSRSDAQYDAAAAEDEFTQVIGSCGDDASLCSGAYYERSQLRAWSLDNAQGALDDISRAIEVYPDSPLIDSLYKSRADIRYQTLDDAPEAIQDLQKAYDGSHDPDYLEQAAAMAVTTEDFDRALALYNQLVQDQAGDPRYLAGRGYVEWTAGDADQAQLSADRALQLDPKLLEAHYLKGLLLLDDDRPEEALAEFQQVSVESDEDKLYRMSQPFLNTDFHHEIFFDMALAAAGTGDLETAQGYVDQALERDSSWVGPYMLRAEILKEQGDLSGARESYLQALDYATESDVIDAIKQALSELAQ
jgi:serine/threonine protein kinase/Flp pilus assembly protein TadD